MAAAPRDAIKIILRDLGASTAAELRYEMQERGWLDADRMVPGSAYYCSFYNRLGGYLHRGTLRHFQAPSGKWCYDFPARSGGFGPARLSSVHASC